MKEALKDMPVSEFPVPSGVVFYEDLYGIRCLAGESCPTRSGLKSSLKGRNRGSSAIYTQEFTKLMSALNQGSLQVDTVLRIKSKDTGIWRQAASESCLTEP